MLGHAGKKDNYDTKTPTFQSLFGSIACIFTKMIDKTRGDYKSL